MNGWDDYLALVLSPEASSGTPDELTTYELGIKGNYVLDNILKHVDHLICDPDDVPFFEIEAGENHLLEDIRQHFGIEAEEGSLLEDMRDRFKVNYYLECKVSSPTHSKVIDSREPVEEPYSFFTKSNQFDWEKWAEAYNSDEDELPPLPTARVLEKQRRKSKFKWELVGLFLLDIANLLTYICLVSFACLAVC